MAGRDSFICGWIFTDEGEEREGKNQYGEMGRGWEATTGGGLEWTDGFVIPKENFQDGGGEGRRLDLERLICIHLHGICMAKRRETSEK